MTSFSHSALAAVLRPLARLCLRHSLRLQDISEALKAAFLEVAEEELRRSGEEVSSSRLSVMTGVHRKDIRRIQEQGTHVAREKSIVSKVIGHWQHNKKFITQSGKPRTLTVEGAKSEFTELVASVSADLNPYTVLFELERIEAVRRTSRGLKLLSQLYLPEGDVAEGFRLLGKDVDDLVLAVEENLRAPDKEPHLHLKTEYDAIPLDQVPTIKTWLVKEGSRFHRKVRDFLSRFDSDVSGSKYSAQPQVRVSLGTFSFAEQIEKRVAPQRAEERSNDTP